MTIFSMGIRLFKDVFLTNYLYNIYSIIQIVIVLVLDFIVLYIIIVLYKYNNNLYIRPFELKSYINN